MSPSLSRRLTTAVAVTSMLAACAHDNVVVPAGGSGGEAVVVDTTPREQPFCSAHEWLCILAGLAVVGGVVAIIKGTGDDTSTDN